jgi:hypothetical protein
MQVDERGAGIGAELIDESASDLLESGEGIAATTALIERMHQLGHQPLVQRVCRLACRNLSYEFAVSSALESQVVTIELRGKALGLERVAYLPEPRAVEGGERLSAPAPESAVQEGGGLVDLVGGAAPIDE